MPLFDCSLVSRLLINLILAINPASDELLVRLNDSGTRLGVADASSNDSSLRLRVGDADAYIVFGIDWDQIAEVRYKDELWKPDRFPALRQEIANTIQAERIIEQWTSHVAPKVHRTSTRPLWQAPERPGPTESASARVQHIEIDAIAANWDADSQWDGLVVRIWPMNGAGQVIRVPGTLTVSLTGDTGYPVNSAPIRLGHWVRAVRTADYGADGISFRLKFQHYEPERWDSTGHWDHRLDPSGDVHVSLAIPGHGVFRASSVTPVRLRRFSPQRDRIYLRTGSRSLIPEP